MTDGNYPQGAQHDSAAPFNQPKIEPKKVYVKLSISFEPIVQINEGYTDEDLRDEAELWAKQNRIEEKISYVTEVF